MTSFNILAVLHTLNTHATVELLSKNLVLLAEAVKLGCQIVILSSKARSVFLKGFFLVGAVILVATQLLVLAASSFDVAAAHVKLVFLILKANLSITDLGRQISIAVLLCLQVFASIEVLSSKSVIITAQSSTFS